MRRGMAYAGYSDLFCACHWNIGVMMLSDDLGKVIALVKGCDNMPQKYSQDLEMISCFS